VGGLRTAAGTLVLDALRRERPSDALAALRGSPSASRLLTQLFVVSLRRCFAGRDPREIAGYVRDLLEWRELPSRGELARRTEALIRAALGEPSLAAAVPAGWQYEIMCLVVGDLARPPGAPQGLIEALIEQSERRVDRYSERRVDRYSERRVGRYPERRVGRYPERRVDRYPVPAVPASLGQRR
jgi:hypothetical protein